MNFDQTEQDSLRQAVSAIGTGAAAAVGMSRLPTLDLLRRIDTVCDSCKQGVESFGALAKLSSFVVDALRQRGLEGKIDPRGDLDGLLAKAVEKLGSLSRAIDRSIASVRADRRLDGMGHHRQDLLDSYGQFVSAVNDCGEQIAEIRRALATHDAPITDIELTQEDLEHVQKCLREPKAPVRRMADSVHNLKKLLGSGFSLSR